MNIISCLSGESNVFRVFLEPPNQDIISKNKLIRLGCPPAIRKAPSKHHITYCTNTARARILYTMESTPKSKPPARSVSASPRPVEPHLQPCVKVPWFMGASATGCALPERETHNPNALGAPGSVPAERIKSRRTCLIQQSNTIISQVPWLPQQRFCDYNSIKGIVHLI